MIVALDYYLLISVSRGIMNYIFVVFLLGLMDVHTLLHIIGQTQIGMATGRPQPHLRHPPMATPADEKSHPRPHPQIKSHTRVHTRRVSDEFWVTCRFK
jgi:hypothetical protein